MKLSKKILLAICSLLFVACSDNGEGNGMPSFTWDVSSARYRVAAGDVLTIIPVYKGVDANTIYIWRCDGKVIGTNATLSFSRVEEGEYYIQLKVTNAYGTVEDELKVTVVKNNSGIGEVDEIVPNDSVFAWKFPWTDINIPSGRTIKVKAYMIENDLDGTYTWTLDGVEVTEPCRRQDVKEISYIFDTEGFSLGVHTLLLTMKNDTCEVKQSFTFHVCPVEGTYRRSMTSESQSLVNKVYEFTPAPGHQVNGYIIVGDMISDGASMEEVCDIVLKHWQKMWSVSLGAQGGYVIAGFDHSVENSGNDYDLVIRGNPFSYQSEPGIIWVSQDVNGDGLPNDPWYELAGSEYGSDNCIQEYAITYYRPTKPKSATAWKDMDGEIGMVPYMEYWNDHDYYWQDWVEGKEHTYFGTRLKDTHTYEDGFTMEYAFDWGYADNGGSDYFRNKSFDTDQSMGYYKISNAKTWDGKDANLQYIDFVKVQTAQTGYSPNLGDISTEVYGIWDYHVKK